MLAEREATEQGVGRERHHRDDRQQHRLRRGLGWSCRHDEALGEGLSHVGEDGFEHLGRQFAGVGVVARAMKAVEEHDAA